MPTTTMISARPAVLTAVLAAALLGGPGATRANEGDLDRARLYEVQAANHGKAGRWDEAIEKGEKALALRTRIHGAATKEATSAAVALARYHIAKRDFAAAEPILREALAEVRNASGTRSEDVGSVQVALGDLYRLSNRYALSERSYRRAIELGAWGARRGLAELKAAQGDYGLMRELEHARREALSRSSVMSREDIERGAIFDGIEALALHDRVLGRDHPETLEAVAHLHALIADRARGYGRLHPFGRLAPELVDRLVRAREVRGDDTSEIHQLVVDAAPVLVETTHLRRDIRRLERALRGRDDIAAETLDALAHLYRRVNEEEHAKLLEDQMLGPPPRRARPSGSNRDADLELLFAGGSAGDRRAGPLLRRAVTARDEPRARYLLSRADGDADDWARIGDVERALAATDAQGTDRLWITRGDELRPALLVLSGQLDAAATLFEAGREAQPGLGNDPRDAVPIIVRVRLGEHDVARDLYTAREQQLRGRVERLRERIQRDADHGFEDEWSAVELAGQRAEHARLRALGALLDLRRGDAAAASSGYAESIAVAATVAPWSYAVAARHAEHAIALLAAGDRAGAGEALDRALAVESMRLRFALLGASRGNRRERAARTERSMHLALTLAVADERATPADHARAFATVLARKQLDVAALQARVPRLRAALGDAEGAMLDEILDLARTIDALQSGRVASVARERMNQLGNHYSAMPKPESLAAHEARLAELDVELREASPAYRAAAEIPTPEDVIATLGGATAIDYVRYRPVVPRAASEDELWAPRRYAACVVRADAGPRCVDLGAAAAIDAEVERFTAALASASGEVHAPGRALHDALVAPLGEHLPERGALVVSPGGALAGVPFAALIDEDDRYLVGRYAIRYVHGTRDLVRPRAAAHAGDAVAIRRGVALRGYDGARPAKVTMACRGTIERAALPWSRERSHLLDPEDDRIAGPDPVRDVALAGPDFPVGARELLRRELAAPVALACTEGAPRSGASAARVLDLAGAPAVVLSMWSSPVWDEPALERLVASDRGRAAAVRAAQLAALADRETAHPHHWAGLLVYDAAPADTASAAVTAADARALRVEPSGRGCGCRASGGPGATAPLVLLVLAALRRRP